MAIVVEAGGHPSRADDGNHNGKGIFEDLFQIEDVWTPKKIIWLKFEKQ